MRYILEDDVAGMGVSAQQIFPILYWYKEGRILIIELMLVSLSYNV